VTFLKKGSRMIQEFWVRTLSKAAWKDFGKNWQAWIMLAAGAVVLMVLSVYLPLRMPEYQMLISLLLCIPGALYTALLHQNGLDAAYNRPLSMFKINSSVVFASLFFIALSLYSPLPQYIPLLALILPQEFQFIIALNWILHAIVSYLLVRCMFVGMVLLEEKCNVIDAFKKSFAMTSHHIIALFGIFLYLAFALILGAVTIVGYFVILPYTMIMKALVYKELYKSLKK
jgi:hypothetical protein